MNNLWFFKFLKIDISKIDSRLSWIEVIHFRQESIEVGLANKLQLGVVSLLILKWKGLNKFYGIK